MAKKYQIAPPSNIKPAKAQPGASLIKLSNYAEPIGSKRNTQAVESEDSKSVSSGNVLCVSVQDEVDKQLAADIRSETQHRDSNASDEGQEGHELKNVFGKSGQMEVLHQVIGGQVDEGLSGD